MFLPSRFPRNFDSQCLKCKILIASDGQATPGRRAHSRTPRGVAGRRLAPPRNSSPRKGLGQRGSRRRIQGLPEHWLVHAAGYPASGLSAKLFPGRPCVLRDRGRPFFPFILPSPVRRPPPCPLSFQSSSTLESRDTIRVASGATAHCTSALESAPLNLVAHFEATHC
jgi:hypothetical protein